MNESLSSFASALAMLPGLGKRLNTFGVTMFTRTSVLCALRIVATISSYALRWFKAQRGSGYSCFNLARIAAARSRSAPAPFRRADVFFGATFFMQTALRAGRPTAAPSIRPNSGTAPSNRAPCS